MKSASRLLAALFSFIFSTAFFGPAHRLLPPVVRTMSFSFIAMVAVFFAAAVTRHVLVAGVDAQSFLVVLATFLLLLMYVAGSKRIAYVLLYMAASSGVDLVVASAGVMGADIMSPALRHPAFVWELLAVAVAIYRMNAARTSAAH